MCVNGGVEPRDFGGEARICSADWASALPIKEEQEGPDGPSIDINQRQAA